MCYGAVPLLVLGSCSSKMNGIALVGPSVGYALAKEGMSAAQRLSERGFNPQSP